MRKSLFLIIITSMLLSGCGGDNNIEDESDSLIISNNSNLYSEISSESTYSSSYQTEILSTEDLKEETYLIASPMPILSPSPSIAPLETESPKNTNIPNTKQTDIPVKVEITPIKTKEPIIASTNKPIETVKDTPIPTEEPKVDIDIPITIISTPEPTSIPEDIYDIVLFFGQSNMNAWPETGALMPTGFENIEQYSIDSGIDYDILSWTVSTSQVKIPIKENVGFIYRYSTNSLEPINENTAICGDGFNINDYGGDTYENSYGGLKYIPETGNLELFQKGDNYISAQTSANQNMIPEFCRQYYELTGHKVITVMAAVGGAPIECFLPYDHPDNYYNVNNTTKHYMYEALVENFNSAVNFANENNLKIAVKYWICFQGEGNNNGASIPTYYERFLTVKNNMAKDIGTMKGLIVYTSNEIGISNGYENTLKIHEIQKNLIENNSDIILGSSFDWDRFIPSEEIYYSDMFTTSTYIDDNGEKLLYEIAFNKAKKLTSYEYDFFDTGQNNRIHLLSCTLSQIGRDCAKNLAKELGY